MSLYRNVKITARKYDMIKNKATNAINDPNLKRYVRHLIPFISLERDCVVPLRAAPLAYRVDYGKSC